MNGTPVLSDRELKTIVALVYQQSGITLHEGKRELVAARLGKRLRHLGMASYEAYLGHLAQDRSGGELTSLLDAIATNHTSFFREAQHFDFLRQRVLPEAVATAGTRGLEVWCAASSTGEEPVTIAITLRDAGVTPFRMLASDISTKALTAAKKAVYRVDRLEGVSQEHRRAYFERGLGEQQGLARVSAELRRLIEYRRLNLVAMDRLDRRFDIIFCRNVMIYFDQAVQQRVVSMLERYLLPGGHLFISHSESLNGVKHGLTGVAPAVFRRPA